MKKFLFILSFLYYGASNAQITIDSSHMPISGDTLRYSIGAFDTTLLFNYQNSGTNLVWNFDSLTPLRQGVSFYENSAQSPYNVNNRIAEKLADTIALAGFEFYDVYSFYSTTSSKYALDHRGISIPTGFSFPFPSSIKIAESFTDEDEIYQFPLDYLDRDSTTYNFEYRNALLGIYYGSSGYRINEVDAWGSLTTPFGTFDCIRVVTDVVGFDSVSFATNDIGFNSHQREYKWLTTQLNIPALTVSGTVIGEVFIPTTVQYRDSVRNVPSLFAPIPLFIANQFEAEVGDTIEFSNFSISLLPPNFEWDIQPENYNYVNGTTSTTDSITVVFTDTGFYDVRLIAINSSGRDTLLLENYIRIDNITSLSEIFKNDQQLLVYPNPASKGSQISIQLKNSEGIKAVKVFDMNGSELVVRDGLEKSQSFQLSTSELLGNYIIQVLTGENRLLTKKIIIQ